MVDTKKLITYIVCYASQRGLKLTTLRLVKFIYLADLYMARETGKTVTGWPWSFVYFGPYCSEVIPAIRQTAKLGSIEMENRESHYSEDDYSLFWCDADIPEDVEQLLPTYVTSKLKAAIRNWGDDSSGLLDHVYFETEPMMDARKGDALDFSLASKPEKQPVIEMKQLSKSKVKKGKEALKKLTSKILAPLAEPSGEDLAVDHEFDKWLRSLDEDDLEVGLKGRAKIDT